jgi:ankyrin repeat protein
MNAIAGARDGRRQLYRVAGVRQGQRDSLCSWRDEPPRLVCGSASRTPPVRGKGSAHLSRVVVDIHNLFRAEARTAADVRRRFRMSAFHRTLPPRPSLAQQKKLAKELLADFRRGNATAAERIRAELPDKTRIGLMDAQFVLAREYGFANWAALSAHIDAVTVSELSLVDRFRLAVNTGDAPALRHMRPMRAELQSIINEPIFAFDAPALNTATDNVDVVDALLALGADPNRKSTWWAGGFHPLYGASPAVAERLLAAGAIPDACALAHLDRYDALIAMLDAEPSRVHERGGDGQTPLHFARSIRVADLLLERGADIDARDNDHRSSAAEWMLGDSDTPKSRLAIARHLVDRGASCDIFLAAATGNTARARALLEADRSLLNRRSGQGEYGEKKPSSFHIYFWTIGSNLTPLQTASKFHQHETLSAMRAFASPVQRLLLACHDGDGDEARSIVRDNPGIVDSLGTTDRRALTDEAWLPNPKAVELMLELGFDPSAPSVAGPTGGTALHCAAWEGSAESVGSILGYPRGRALIETRDPVFQGTPLGWCCHGSLNCHRSGADHAEVARLLISAGAPTGGDHDASDAVLAVIDEAHQTK